MAVTAPAFKWIDDKSAAALAPLTRDLFRTMVRNYHHLLVRVTGDTTGLTTAQIGHKHAGGDDGMPIPRHLDSRQSGVAIWYCNLTDALHGLTAPDLDWRGVSDFKMAAGWYSVPCLNRLLVSPGMKYLSARLRYAAQYSATYNWLTNLQHGYAQKNMGRVRMRARPSGGAWVNASKSRILYPNTILDSGTYYPVTLSDSTMHDWYSVTLGPTNTPGPEGVLAPDFDYMVDISDYTDGDDARYFDLDFQVLHLPAVDCAISFLGYDIYEIASPPQG